jgi:hypothetical protein
MCSGLRGPVLVSLICAGVWPAAARGQADSLEAVLLRNRHALTVAASGLPSGPGGALLVEAGRSSRFFLVGEEHGVAEVPELTTALFRALVPHGYRHLAIETGDGIAAQLNRLAASAEPLAALREFFTEYHPAVPFYTLRQEAQLLVDAVAAAGGREDVLWGIDYDILADRWPLRRLRELAPDAAARAAADRAIAFADAQLERALATGNPGLVLMFGGPDTMVAGLRRTYRAAPDGEADRIISLMEATLRINGHWAARRIDESNVDRARHLKQQFARHWAAIDHAADPRVMIKLGANHTPRGRNWTNTFDVGNLAAEMAEAGGARSFHVMVVGGPGTQHAVMDPRVLRYMAAPASSLGEPWAARLAAAVLPDAWTVFDLRPLRPLLVTRALTDVPAELAEMIWRFDAVVVLTGSTPAVALVGGGVG